MPFIVSVCNLKGGVAKTTASMLLASQLEQLLPGKVVVLDSDKQGSASLWHGRGRCTVPVVAANGYNLEDLVSELSEQYTAIVVDCPPSADAPVTKVALANSNLLLVPCPPAPLDYEATTMLIEVVKARHPQLRVLVVPTLVPTTPTDVSKAVLSKMTASWPVAKSQLAARTAYREASALGVTLRETKGRGAAQAQQEIDRLTQEVLLTLTGA